MKEKNSHIKGFLKIFTFLIIFLLILFLCFQIKKLRSEILTQKNIFFNFEKDNLKNKKELEKVKNELKNQELKIKNIDLKNIDCENCIKLGRETEGDFLSNIKESNHIRVNGLPKENAEVTLSLKENSITDDLLKYKMGQNLTPTSSPTFNNLFLNNLKVSQDITCQNCISLGSETQGRYIENIVGNNQINVSTFGENNLQVSLGIKANSIGNEQLLFDTGQHLTSTSSPTFAGLNLTDLRKGYVLFTDDKGKIIQDSDFYWDNTNKRLGIGTNIPEATLDINGNLRINSLTSGFTNNVLVHDSGVIYERTIDSKVWGSSLVDYSEASSNYIPKMVDSDTITNSSIYELNNKIGIGTTNPGAKLDIVPNSSSEVVLRTKSLQSTAPLGEEKILNGNFSIVPDTSWTWGDGWSHDTSNYEADHSSGYTDPLTQEVNIISGGIYQVEFEIKNNTGGGCIRIKIGDFYVPNEGDYSWFCYNSIYRRPFIAGGASGSQTFSIIPSSSPSFQGSIDNVTVRPITGISQSNIVFVDDEDSVVSEFKGKSSINSFFWGKDSGRYNTTGSFNLGLGNNSLWSNTTGQYNIAIGHNSLYYNTYGEKNIAIGNYAGYKNIWGYENIVLGNWAFYNNTGGYGNIAIGRKALYSNTRGYANIAIGYESLHTNTVGYDNVALGNYTLRNNTGNSNTAVGEYALYNNQGASGNSAFGYQSLYFNTTGTGNVGIGNSALWYNTSGSYNVGLGSRALWNNTAGSFNVGIGGDAGIGGIGASYQNNVLIGYRSGAGLVSGSNNILIGYQSGDNLTTGSGNIVIGYNIDAPLSDGNNRLSIGNLIFATGLDGIGTNISTGNVGIGVINPNAKLEINGGLRLNTEDLKPVCSSSQRGTLWFTKGGSGVKDTLEICVKDEFDNYTWATIY